MEERILYFDIVNGISGDMTIATLLDLGISKEVFLEEINKLNLGDEFNINIQEENEDGIVGTKVEVITKEVNAHRHLSDIYEIIDKSSLNEYVKENAKKIFMVIAEAEAKVHGTTIDKIHFHEVGAIDSIVDVVSACILVDLLCVDKIYATTVPVGEDQLPLIEQCREIVRKFNSIYGETLIEPEPVLSSSGRIKGLDGNEKMGKSLGNAIYLSDSEEEITRKVMSAVTDPARIKKDDPGNPDICMVAYYHNLFTKPEDVKTVCEECKAGKRGCVACKKQLAQNIIEELRPIREKRAYYEAHPEEVDKILMEGTEKARVVAKETMKKVKKAMMLDY